MSNNSTFGDLVRIVYLDNDKLKKKHTKKFYVQHAFLLQKCHNKCSIAGKTLVQTIYFFFGFKLYL